MNQIKVIFCRGKNLKNLKFKLRYLGNENFEDSVDIQYIDLSSPPDFLAFLTNKSFDFMFKDIWAIFKSRVNRDLHKSTGLVLETLIHGQKRVMENEEIGGILICFKDLSLEGNCL